MSSLILKDIIVQKKSIVLMILVMTGVLSTNGINPLISNYYLFSVTIAYAFSMGGFAYEEKNRCELFINSLPITRKEVVLSKYIEVFIFAVLALIITSILGVIFSLSSIGSFRNEHITVGKIKSIVFSCIILSSIIFPIYFKFGYLKGRIISTVFYFMFFMFSLFAMTGSQFEPIRNIIGFIASGAGNVLMLLISIIVYVTSMYISLGAYSNKEF